MNAAGTGLVGHVIPFRCSAGLQFTGPVDITMTAAYDVDLHEVEIRLVAENAGLSSGPAAGGTLPTRAVNTFSEDDLESAFGSTRIPGGTVKTLRFRTKLPCLGTAPQAVAAEIQFVEFSGRKNSVTVTAPFEEARRD